MKAGYRLLFAALVVSAIFPCSVDLTPSFVPVGHPEKFDTTFVRGELGIIPATLAGKYKLIAWRYLAGLPLDSGEQAEILSAEKRPDPSDVSKNEWLTARKSEGVADLPYIRTDKESHLDEGTFYENCLPDAFAVAARTLYDRQRAYGDSKLLADWVAAQDQVFQNCSSEQPSYPKDAGADLPALFRADRTYQIAAAHFYAEDLTEAERRFREIAGDSSSPWRDTAAYLVARTLVREFSLQHKGEASAAAKMQLLTVTGTPLRNSAQGLIGYVGSLDDPASVFKALADRLSIPHSGSAFSAALDEAAFVLKSNRFRAAKAQANLPEPFDWIRALQSDQSEYALQRWQQAHTTLWLTAALIRAQPSRNDAERKANAELIDAAFKVPENSPAFDTAVSNSIRLMIADGQRDVARRKLDGLLAAKRRRLDSVENIYREQRMSLATSFDDFLRWAPRRPIGIQDEENSERVFFEVVNKSQVLGNDSVEALNDKIPLTRLADAAGSTRLPPTSRTDVAISGWTRAFILGNDEVSNRLSLQLAGTRPGWASDLEALRKLNGDDKRFAQALLVARHSEFHPEIWMAFQPQWWCPKIMPDKPEHLLSDAVLSPSERTEAATEVKRISDSGTAQNLLAPIIMSWATSHPNDSRNPEALHRLVRITRYGCRTDSANGQISKAAFDMLHSRYPASEWTRQTPYWFN